MFSFRTKVELDILNFQDTIFIIKINIEKKNNDENGVTSMSNILPNKSYIKKVILIIFLRN